MCGLLCQGALRGSEAVIQQDKQGIQHLMMLRVHAVESSQRKVLERYAATALSELRSLRRNRMLCARRMWAELSNGNHSSCMNVQLERWNFPGNSYGIHNLTLRWHSSMLFRDVVS